MRYAVAAVLVLAFAAWMAWELKHAPDDPFDGV